MERTGLGTPATRAGVIEKLVRGGFLERKGRQLLPTKKGHNLIVVLPDSIKSAKLTAEWEAALKEVERGERSADDFLSGIERMTADLVEGYRAIQADTSLFDQREPIGKCPRCGKDVKILLTTDWFTPAVNGVVTSVLNLRRGLENRGHEVRILPLSRSPFSYV